MSKILRNVEVATCLLTVCSALMWLAVQSVTRCRAYYERIDAFSPIITKGWLPWSYGIDLTDRQWRIWRETAPILVPFLLLGVFCSRRLSGRSRLKFYACWGLVFAVILHGTGVVWLVVSMLVNYYVLVLLGKSSASPIWTWCFGLGLLYGIKLCEDSYWAERMQSIGVQWMGEQTFSFIFEALFPRFDGLYSGVYKWSAPLNLTILRFISFNIEYWSAVRRQHQQRIDPIDPKNTVLTPSTAPSDSTVQPIRSDDLTPRDFLHFFSYAMYPPLYVAGPIMTYNSFDAQLYGDYPAQRGQNDRKGFALLGSALVYGLCLEVVLHYVYYHAINHNIKVIFHHFAKDVFFIPPWEIMLCAFFVLNFMYVKFLVIWRTGAAVARLDGFSTEDNMRRCVCNNYSFSGFWRSWHGSFHGWILRYVYLPLGGRRTQYLSIWPIFVFIGLWHDLEVRWVCWALSNALCLVLERLLLASVAASRWAAWRSRWWWRYVAAGAAVCDIYLLMLCNLSILHGYRGSWDLLRAWLDPPRPWAGPADVLLATGVGSCWLLAGVLLMFRIRDAERCPAALKAA